MNEAVISTAGYGLKIIPLHKLHKKKKVDFLKKEPAKENEISSNFYCEGQTLDSLKKTIP